jgi:hypothetical protein
MGESGVKFCIAIVVAALIFTVLALRDLDARAGGAAEITVSYKQLRGYDPATNAFTSVSYLVKTVNGPGCAAVLTVDAGSVAAINALGIENGLPTWSGSRSQFAVSGLPNPCP